MQNFLGADDAAAHVLLHKLAPVEKIFGVLAVAEIEAVAHFRLLAIRINAQVVERAFQRIETEGRLSPAGEVAEMDGPFDLRLVLAAFQECVQVGDAHAHLENSGPPSPRQTSSPRRPAGEYPAMAPERRWPEVRRTCCDAACNRTRTAAIHRYRSRGGT